ncbi:phosphotransferase family protein [Cellulomonas sp. S1-8]|uniref:phosphotransferase family protein n=1 Tax=Cellulomonas sp. S1-8 TaxID=2904790 RepID=UPI002244401D|nr:hypothetical protein [Cellulomonas sp. S1-8]UZN03404.1 hypothetical protein OKX07_00210 [Cellulomonas sp. S1-8]
MVDTGSSGAVVTIVTLPCGTRRAVKSARWGRVSAPQQAAARDRIAPHFPGRLPQVLHASRRRGRDVLVTECPSATTLADVHATDPARAVRIWRDVVEDLERIWRSTAVPGFTPALATRSHSMRWRRAVQGLEWALPALGLGPGDTLDTRLVVNGRDHGALGAALDRLAGVPAPAVHVTCQGDPQPRNVLVEPDDRWHLVDWEWAGTHHDWRMLLSHVIGWWQVEGLLEGSRGSVRTSAPGRAELTYDLPDSPRADVLAPGLAAFESMTDPHRRDADATALAHHTAMLYLREVPRVVPERPWLAAPLIGEAVRLVTAR